jgi:Domain of unknown function (DUF4253)
MPASRLPEDGNLRLGSVILSGGRVRAEGRGEPVAWVTDGPVPDAGRIWRELCAMAAGTGLQPVVHVTPEWIPGYRPGEDFYEPEEIADIDRMNAADILAELWDGKTRADDDPRYAALGKHAPFPRPFPGLAPATGGQLGSAEALHALASLPSAYLSLVAAARPADVLPTVGWGVTDAWDSMLPIAAVLRTWEDRFGARLLQLGPSAELRLLVDRPPRTMAAAQAIAAEHWAFCGAWVDQFHDIELTTIPDMVPRILNGAVWGFWWD